MARTDVLILAGVRINSLEELFAHFEEEEIKSLLQTGRLVHWLQTHDFQVDLNAVASLDQSSEDFGQAFLQALHCPENVLDDYVRRKAEEMQRQEEELLKKQEEERKKQEEERKQQENCKFIVLSKSESSALVDNVFGCFLGGAGISTKSDSECVLTEWCVKVGDTVKKGSIVAKICCDRFLVEKFKMDGLPPRGKISNSHSEEVSSPMDGIVVALLVKQWDVVPFNSKICQVKPEDAQPKVGSSPGASPLASFAAIFAKTTIDTTLDVMRSQIRKKIRMVASEVSCIPEESIGTNDDFCDEDGLGLSNSEYRRMIRRIAQSLQIPISEALVQSCKARTVSELVPFFEALVSSYNRSGEED